MIDRNLAEIPIIKDKAQEALRKIEMNNAALEAQLLVAQQFMGEEVRRENKLLAYELAKLGIDRISQVDAEEDQARLGEDLRKLLTEVKNGSSTTEEEMDSFLDSMEK